MKKVTRIVNKKMKMEIEISCIIGYEIDIGRKYFVLFLK